MIGEPLRYVAMGSSFGAGPGLRPRAQGSPRRSGRSAVNASHLLAQRLGLDLLDVTFSGATVAQLRRGGPGDVVAQVAAVDSNVSLVTITAGGNDVGYLPALTLASLPSPLGAAVSARRRVADLIDPVLTEQRFGQLDVEVRGLLGDIARSAPAAQVIVVGYLTILPPAGAAPEGLPPTVSSWGTATAERLAATLAGAAADAGATFADAGAASTDHHAWSREPWTNRFHYTLRGGAAYHPNAEGMRGVAGLIAREIAPRP